MIERQIAEWNQYPPQLRIIVVDDASPEPALPIIQANASSRLRESLSLYRITVDVPWNRGEARNLGALQAKTDWLVHADIDHVLPAQCARQLFQFEPNPKHWYRFPRWRKGRADETRRKDAIPESQEFGEIRPHIDSYLIRKELYWLSGGYDPDFSGCLGGGTEFLARLERLAEPPQLLPKSIALHVYTRSEIADASDWSLSRDRTAGKARMKAKHAHGRPVRPIRSAWERQL